MQTHAIPTFDVAPLDCDTAGPAYRLHNGDVIPVHQSPWPYYSSYVRAMYPTYLCPDEATLRIKEYKAFYFDYFISSVEDRRSGWDVTADGRIVRRQFAAAVTHH